MYPNLKLAIFKQGIRQNHLAKDLGIDETVLSKIIRGYREPSTSQRKLISSYLAVDENWLFERYDGVPKPPNSNHVLSGQERKDGDS